MELLALLEALKRCLSQRTLRLFTCAYCRQRWSILERSSQYAVEMAEKNADKPIWNYELKWAMNHAIKVAYEMRPPGDRETTRSHFTWMATCALRENIEEFLPFCLAERGEDRVDILRDMIGPPVSMPIPWNTPLLKQLAQAAYEDRGETGELNTDRLLILSDALAEAQAPEEWAHHLRQGTHYRGCWVLDQLRSVTVPAPRQKPIVWI